MNVVRRVLLAVYSLVLLAALGGLAALAWNQDEQLDLTIEDLNLQGFVDAGDGAKWAFTGVLAGIAVVALVTLLIAIWPKRSGYSSKGTLRIRQSDGGTVEVTAGAIESLLRGELEALPEVRSARPKVRLSGGAVDTYLEANVEPSASIAHATKLIGATVEETLRDHVGVTAVRRPVIRVTYDEMGVRPAGSIRRPAPVDDGAYRSDTLPQGGDQPRTMSPATQMKPPADPARPPEAPYFTNPHDEGAQERTPSEEHAADDRS
jgi:hypothetical protein